MSSFNQRECTGCGEPVDDLHCRWCTCERCGYNLRDGFCLFCNSRDGNSFAYDPNPNSSDYPHKSQYKNAFLETPKVLSLAWEKFFEIQHAQPEDIQELLRKLLKDLQIISEELADYINTLNWNRPTFYDNDDDDEYTIQYREYLENSSNVITHDLPIEEPDNSLSMGDEHLSTILEIESDKVIKSSVEDLVPIPSESEGISDDTCDVPFCDNSPPLDVFNDHFEIFFDFNDDCTSSNDDSFKDIDYVQASPPEDSLSIRDEHPSTIPEKESDKFIKSSVEDLVPIPSESKDISGNNSECDLPSCDDFSPINVYKEKSMTFYNPLFNSNDDFTSSDDESLSDEDISGDNVKIYSNPLFEFDDEYISITPLSDYNKDECLTPVNEIEFLLHRDPSTPTMSVDDFYDSEGDVLYLESLLIDDTTPSLPSKVFLDRDPRSLSDINDLKSLIKVFNPEIHEKKISPTYVRLPFEDRHYLSLTYVIRIFFPYLTYSMNSSLPLSSGSEDTIFDPGMSAFHFSSLELLVMDIA
ncbi:hypothetical protein Tco_0417726 [Tanacetum coccineum]